jgi:quercetin dioxygenase-like cupin family protein
LIVPRAARLFRQLPGRESADPFGGSAAGFSMRIVRVEGGWPRSPHRHSRSHEAIYVVSGKGLLWEDGVERSIEAGDCALIDPGVAHATIPNHGTPMELVCFFPDPDIDNNTEELEDIVIAGRGREGNGA